MLLIFLLLGHGCITPTYKVVSAVESNASVLRFCIGTMRCNQRDESQELQLHDCHTIESRRDSQRAPGSETVASPSGSCVADDAIATLTNRAGPRVGPKRNRTTSGRIPCKVHWHSIQPGWGEFFLASPLEHLLATLDGTQWATLPCDAP